MSAYTKGPLTVKVTERWPFNIETIDAEGDVIFSTRMPCNSTQDKSADDVINCVNFPADKWAEYAAINRRAVADEVLRAAAPDSHEANVKTVDALADAFGIHDDWDDERIYDSLPSSAVAAAYFAARAAVLKARGEA